MNLPRVGQEVLVDFLGGDPDRPIVTGRVYTNLQQVPYGLPANKTQSGWKSNSRPTTGGYNEIMLEDKAGQELIRMQAEKDLHKLVKNDEQVKIGRDRTKQVGHDDSHTVGNDRTHQVGNDEDISVGNDQSKSVGNDESTTVGANRSKSVGGNEDSTIAQDLSQLVGGNEREVTSGNKSSVVGSNRATQIGGIDSNMVGDTYSVMISPPGESNGGGNATALFMKDDLVHAATKGGAMVTHKGNTLTLTADHIVIHGKQSVQITTDDGPVIVKGGPNVMINPSTAKANEALKNMDTGSLPTSASSYRKLAQQNQDLAEQLGAKYGFPPALLLGMMSNESGFGTQLGADGWNSTHKAYGWFQVAQGSKTVTDAPDGVGHMTQAMTILQSRLAEVSSAFPEWTPEQQLAGALVAYNAYHDKQGNLNVKTQPKDPHSWQSMDAGTDANKYSRDIWAQAQWFSSNLVWNRAGRKTVDYSTGHDDCKPRPASSGSKDVLVEDHEALRVDDTFAPHSCPKLHPVPHSDKVTEGSHTVTINDKAAARRYDPLDHEGAEVRDGSKIVDIGG